MHLSCICASKFAPVRGPIKAPTGAFPPNKSAGLSARSCVTSQVREAIPWAIFCPSRASSQCFCQAPALVINFQLRGRQLQWSMGGEVFAVDAGGQSVSQSHLY